jgi:hypothetical protein
MAIVPILLPLLLDMPTLKNDEQNSRTDHGDSIRYVRFGNEKEVRSTHATPRIMGIVKVDELTGSWHAFAPQLPVAVDDEDVDVAAARASTTRLGTTIFIIASILPRVSGSAIGTRGPNLTIFARGKSIWSEASSLVASRWSNDKSAGEGRENRVRR